jgi:hypothetical protein
MNYFDIFTRKHPSVAAALAPSPIAAQMLSPLKAMAAIFAPPIPSSTVINTHLNLANQGSQK